MANIVQIKRSSVQGKKPQDSDLEVGELAVNLYDGLLYSKNTAGNVIVVGSSTTSNVTEGVNLYFTNTRAISALTAGSGVSIAANGRITATSTSGDTGFTTIPISNTNLQFFGSTVVFQFDKTLFRSATFEFVIENGDGYKHAKHSVIHNGTSIAYSNTETNLGFPNEHYFDISGNNIRLVVLQDSASAYVRNYFSEPYTVYGSNINVKGSVSLISV